MRQLVEQMHRDLLEREASPDDYMPIPMKPPLVSEMIAPLRSEMMSPPRRQGRAGYVCCYFVRAGRQASEGDLTRRMLSPSRSRRWALWTSRSRMASA